MDIIKRKKHFVRILEERLFLRFHMSLILTGTALVGLLASKCDFSRAFTHLAA